LFGGVIAIAGLLGLLDLFLSQETIALVVLVAGILVILIKPKRYVEGVLKSDWRLFTAAILLIVASVATLLKSFLLDILGIGFFEIIISPRVFHVFYILIGGIFILAAFSKAAELKVEAGVGEGLGGIKSTTGNIFNWIFGVLLIVLAIIQMTGVLEYEFLGFNALTYVLGAIGVLVIFVGLRNKFILSIGIATVVVAVMSALGFGGVSLNFIFILLGALLIVLGLFKPKLIMSRQEYLKSLHQKVSAGTATPEEASEFHRAVNAGEYI